MYLTSTKTPNLNSSVVLKAAFTGDLNFIPLSRHQKLHTPQRFGENINKPIMHAYVANLRFALLGAVTYVVVLCINVVASTMMNMILT